VTSSLGDSERDLLRQMVRQVLADVVPQTMGAAASDQVAITTDADLQAFARRIALATQAERDAIVSGARTFHLAAASHHSAQGEPAAQSTAVVRVDKGAVTERHVRQAADTGSDLVLGKRAVLTPLARDRARVAGVKITKET
jgi:hypothetical protein